MGKWEWFGMGFGTAVAVWVLLKLLVLGGLFRLYIQAVLCMCPVPFIELVGMALRRNKPRTIVLSYIRLNKAGVTGVKCFELEAHQLAGGNVTNVASAVIGAFNAGVEYPWDLACQWELAGHDPYQVFTDAKARGLAAVPSIEDARGNAGRS